LEMSKIVDDLSMHFDNRLRRLISDIASTCDIADLSGVDAAKIIMSGLTYETIRLAVMMEMSEREYMAMCLLGYRSLAKHIRKELKEKENGK